MFYYNEIDSFNKLELGLICCLLKTKRRKISPKRQFTNEEIKRLQGMDS